MAKYGIKTEITEHLAGMQFADNQDGVVGGGNECFVVPCQC